MKMRAFFCLLSGIILATSIAAADTSNDLVGTDICPFVTTGNGVCPNCCNQYYYYSSSNNPATGINAGIVQGQNTAMSDMVMAGITNPPQLVPPSSPSGFGSSLNSGSTITTPSIVPKSNNSSDAAPNNLWGGTKNQQPTVKYQ